MTITAMPSGCFFAISSSCAYQFLNYGKEGLKIANRCLLKSLFRFSCIPRLFADPAKPA
jgi:hypothetical protein